MGGSPQLREGSADSYKQGSLIRRLQPIRLANVTATPTGTRLPNGEHAFRVEVKNLTSGLTCHIATALCVADGSNQNPIVSTDYPAIPGTMQLTPIVDNPQAPRAFLRPVFQDPTATDNKNHPLGEDLPFGWSFVSEGADMVRVDVVVDPVNYGATLLECTLIVFCTIEYTGSWWDTKVVEQAIGQVVMTQVSDPEFIYTGE